MVEDILEVEKRFKVYTAKDGVVFANRHDAEQRNLDLELAAWLKNVPTRDLDIMDYGTHWVYLRSHEEAKRYCEALDAESRISRNTWHSPEHTKCRLPDEVVGVGPYPGWLRVEYHVESDWPDWRELTPYRIVHDEFASALRNVESLPADPYAEEK